MKSKKIKVLVIIFMLMFVPINIFAYGGIDTNITIGGDTNGDNQIGEGDAIYSSVGVTSTIVGVFQVIGTIVSIITLIIIGIRYMISSVEEKAQMKGVIGYWVTGCILVCATSNVLGFAYAVIDDVRHTYGPIEIRISATCQREGVAVRECEDAGCTEKITISIPKTAHSWKTTAQQIQAPTCTEEGYKAIVCRGCNTEKEGSRTAISKKAHEWNPTKRVDVEATCAAEGYMATYCKICGGKKENSGETIPKRPGIHPSESIVTFYFKLANSNKHTKYEACKACGHCVSYTDPAEACTYNWLMQCKKCLLSKSAKRTQYTFDLNNGLQKVVVDWDNPADWWAWKNK